MKTVVVTGGSKGIGKAIIYEFAKVGYNVLLNYNTSEESAKNILIDLKDVPGIVEIFKADVTKKEEVDKMLEYAKQEFGSIDVVINNAGVSNVKLLTDITDEEITKILDVNLKGVINVSKSALEHGMLQDKNGTIINISSIWGITGAAMETVYSASKAGVIGFTKALAKELVLNGITVNAIAPGAIDTDMMYKTYSKEEIKEIIEEIPMKRFGTPLEIAKLALYLASDNARYMTGQIISPNGGLVI